MPVDVHQCSRLPPAFSANMEEGYAGLQYEGGAKPTKPLQIFMTARVAGLLRTWSNCRRWQQNLICESIGCHFRMTFITNHQRSSMIDDIKKTLWASADKLRANMDAAEYKHLVLGLIFVKYISDAFVARQAELSLRLRDPADELFYGDAADEDIAAELEDRDYYTSENVFWVPEGARWDALRAAAPQPDIGKRIDDALTLIFGRNWGGLGYGF